MASFPAVSSVDKKGVGVVGALQAAAFLKKSGLKESVLSDIWEVSDPGGRGVLDKHAFFVALKLISAVQNGNEAKLDSLTINLPPPLFKGASVKSTQNSPVVTKLSPPSSKSNNNNNNKPEEEEENNDENKDSSNKHDNDIINISDAEWSIPLKERIKYDHIFDTLGPSNNLLHGNKVRPVLLNSKLPLDTLGHVWDLSDIDGDGSLDREEFSVAMHLVYKALQKIEVPKTLPVEMVPPSKRKEVEKKEAKLKKRASRTSIKKEDSFDDDAFDDLARSTLVDKPAEKSRKASVNSEDEGGGSGSGTPTRPNPPSVGWVVSAQTKSYCDKLFVKADTDKDGYLNGLEIKKIFVTSGLPQATLAKIWNLCDTRNMGKLNRDQFALAMHLIQSKIKGQPLPNKLTPAMLPPSARRNSLGDSTPPPGVVFDMKTSGMKEIEAMTSEIDELKSKKTKLETERVDLDEGVGEGEKGVAGLQKEIEVVVDAVKQLNKQRNEAQKKLLELDEKKSQSEKASKETEAGVEKEELKITELKEQLKNRDNLNKSLEEDLKGKREELAQLREQEMKLETSFERSHRRLVQLAKLFHASQMQLSQIDFNVDKLTETKKQIEANSRAYDQLLAGQITELEANALIDPHITSPTLNIDISSTDMMSDMVHTSEEEMADFQSKLSAIHSDAGMEENDEEQTADKAEVAKETKEPAPEETKKQEDLWTDVPFANAPASNDPFAIGFITADTVAEISTEDPFGQGTFMPASLKPARPSRPPQPKQSSPVPARPKSPVPPRPKSPAPPKSPSKQAPPSRPPAPGRSPSKSPVPAFGDNDDFFKDQFNSDMDLK